MIFYENILKITVLLIVACYAKGEVECRRETFGNNVKKSSHQNRYVRVDCSGRNVPTLSSRFLEEFIKDHPKDPEHGEVPTGVLHDVGMGTTDASSYQVTLEDANIEEVEDGTFNVLPTLEVLNMKSNKLGKIGRRTFEGLKNLKDLSLDRNKISIVEPASFSELRSLRYLTFSENMLQELNYFTFHGLRQSIILNLKSNNISVLNSGSFASMPQLENLYLSYNKISVLDGATLAGLRNLRYLILSGNNIESIRSGTFGGNSELESLDLSNNLLSKITTGTFRGLLYIRRLSLRNNDLSFIEDGSFMSMPLLNELDLSHNGLTTMSSGWFWGLINLRYFFVNSNSMHKTALKEAKSGEYGPLMESIGLICRKRGLHFGNLRGNGIYDAIEYLTVDIVGFDLKRPDQHRCAF